MIALPFGKNCKMNHQKNPGTLSEMLDKYYMLRFALNSVRL